MRTTLVIDDELYSSIKKEAAENGASVSATVNEALRGYLSRRERRGENQDFRLPTFSGGGESVDTLPSELRELAESEEMNRY